MNSIAIKVDLIWTYFIAWFFAKGFGTSSEKLRTPIKVILIENEFGQFTCWLYGDWMVTVKVLFSRISFTIQWPFSQLNGRHISVTFQTIFYFVCVDFIVQFENFSLLWKRHHCRWRAANLDLCSALMALEQWEFFNVPHQLWHGPTLYDGHLRGPVTLTCCRAFDSGAVTTYFYDLGLSSLGIEPQSPACRANAPPLRHRSGLSQFIFWK